MTRAPMSQLRHQLAGKQMLIVLDNGEHLSEACAGLVDEYQNFAITVTQ